MKKMCIRDREGIVSAAAQLLLQIVDGAGQPGIGGIRAHDADGAHGTQPQASGKYVRCVAQLLHDGQNPVPRFLTDIGLSLIHIYRIHLSSADELPEVCG